MLKDISQVSVCNKLLKFSKSQDKSNILGEEEHHTKNKWGGAINVKGQMGLYFSF